MNTEDRAKELSYPVVGVDCCRVCRFPTVGEKRVVVPLDNAARTLQYYHQECLPEDMPIICITCGKEMQVYRSEGTFCPVCSGCALKWGFYGPEKQS